MKAVLLEMFSDGELPTNPIPKKLKLKEKRVADIHPYSDEELKKLFKAARPREFRHYEPLINYVFDAGFRPEENYGMLWECADLRQMALEIKEVRTLRKAKDPKTERAGRVVDITAGMAKWIIAQKSRSALRSKYVWVTVTGRPVDQSDFAKVVWKPLHDAAKVKYRPPKQARHTFATRHIDRGTEPRWIAHQMGTSLEQLFETYTAEWNRARDRKAAEPAKMRSHVIKRRGL